MNIKARAASLSGAIIAASLVAASAVSQEAPRSSRPEYVDPRVYSATEAARALSETEISALPGQFAFVVKGGGRDAERVFLNSDVDYRDAGTLTVAVAGPALAALTQQLDGPPERRLIGRTILATGVARRARIDLLENGRATGRYYFQTHVTVEQAGQIHVIPGPALPITVRR